MEPDFTKFEFYVIQWNVELEFWLKKIHICHCMGKVLGPLGLGPWPCGAIHDLIPVGFMALIRAHLEAWSKLKNHNESILVGSAIARGYPSSRQLDIALRNIATEQTFGRWEPVPMPLPSFPTEHPLINDGIGPPSTRVRSGSNHNTSTYLKL